MQYGKFAAERLRPVADLLARLPVEAPGTVYDLSCGDAFMADYTARIARAYPRGDDGRTLFPFRRLFIAAVR